MDSPQVIKAAMARRSQLSQNNSDSGEAGHHLVSAKTITKYKYFMGKRTPSRGSYSVPDYYGINAAELHL